MRAAAPLAIALATLLGACGDGAPIVDGLAGAALGAWPDGAWPSKPTFGPVGTSPAAAEESGLRWSFDPPELQVYRSTAVHLRVDSFPEGHAGARCTFGFGDGTPPAEGCQVSHTFHGGQADQPVTLTLVDGAWTLTATQVIPLERLSVTTVEGGDVAADGTVPPPPKPAPTSFRVLFAADSAGVPQLDAAITTALASAAPDLVLHAGGAVSAGGGDADWDAAREAFEVPARGARVPLVWAMSPTDLAEGARVKRPELSLLDGAGYPARYTFTFKGAFFLVISSDPREGITAADLAWMRTALEQAQVYESRFVVSHLPLHKFADDGAGVVNDKFKLYELLLRARVTAFVSAGHKVYFKGRYGALAVLSVGTPATRAGRLSGSDFAQPGSLAVMDVIGGVPQRVFALEAPGFERALDEGYLPETVEVYTR